LNVASRKVGRIGRDNPVIDVSQRISAELVIRKVVAARFRKRLHTIEK
jgi:hypothetical protein